MSRRKVAYTNEKIAEPESMLNREIFLSFWKIHVLHHASEAPIYGHWIMRELHRHGYQVSPGTVYPLLRRMEQNGWIMSLPAAKKHPKAPIRYKLTSAGKKILQAIRKQVVELHNEVIDL